MGKPQVLNPVYSTSQLGLRIPQFFLPLASSILSFLGTIILILTNCFNLSMSALRLVSVVTFGNPESIPRLHPRLSIIGHSQDGCLSFRSGLGMSSHLNERNLASWWLEALCCCGRWNCRGTPNRHQSRGTWPEVQSSTQTVEDIRSFSPLLVPSSPGQQVVDQQQAAPGPTVLIAPLLLNPGSHQLLDHIPSLL